nr:recombinase family protein [uncultured Carboxylicivirga sp.]
MKIGYARVSTKDQNLEMQIETLNKTGCTKIFQGTKSALKERPELEKMLEHTREGDIIVVWKLDRLGSSMPELIDNELYNVEFPELSRLLSDTQNGYSRVRNCAQARAIENECFVAITGSVGNLSKVHNMDIQYAQSMVFTPSDCAFPTNGIKAEVTPNTEMILLSDVDINSLRELNQF